MKPSRNFEDLVEMVSVLRKECPWDRKQTHESLKDHLIEEAYEAIDAIDSDRPDELRKELGDILLHIVFHSKIASEKSAFSIEDVIESLMEKLIRRHPHVFGDSTVQNEQEVASNWEKIKLTEGKESILDGLPAHFPALMRAQRMQEKTGNVGFDWSEWKLAWEKLEEEFEEWKEALEKQDHDSRFDEFGDLIFSLVNVGRLLGMDAEDALRNANRKFERRFRYIEQQLGRQHKSISDSSLDEMDFHWNEAKKKGL